MKYSWRITKYNPSFRDERGAYQREEWTSIYDVGREFMNKPFTIHQYIETEALYIKAIEIIRKCFKVDLLKVVSLEKNKYNEREEFKNVYTSDMYSLYHDVREGAFIDLEQLANLSKLILRENLWCKLEANSRMYIHFGFDYYIFIGSSFNCSQQINAIEALGLFVEPFISPYLDEG